MIKDLNLLYPPFAIRVQEIQERWYERTETDLIILETLRLPARQDQLYLAGAATSAKSMQSLHQYGLAVDFIVDRNPAIKGIQDPYSNQIDWTVLAEICQQYSCNWGGKWKDYGHVELSIKMTVDEMAEIFRASSPYGLSAVWAAIGGGKLV